MLEVISTFYIKEEEHKKFRDNLEQNKKKVDAIMPKGITCDGIYIHGFGNTFKYESRFSMKDTSLLSDLLKVVNDDEYSKSFGSYIDRRIPIETYTVNKLV